MKRFVRFYEFLLQVSCFEDVELHKKYKFIALLLAYVNIKHPGSGFNLDGKITAIFGTHTHVQTADEQILPNGTGYITDIGMTGPKNSVIGMDAQASIKRFETTLPEKYKLAEGECILNAVIFNIDDTTSKVTDIKRIYIR